MWLVVYTGQERYHSVEVLGPLVGPGSRPPPRRGRRRVEEGTRWGDGGKDWDNVPPHRHSSLSKIDWPQWYFTEVWEDRPGVILDVEHLGVTQEVFGVHGTVPSRGNKTPVTREDVKDGRVKEETTPDKIPDPSGGYPFLDSPEVWSTDHVPNVHQVILVSE